MAKMALCHTTCHLFKILMPTSEAKPCFFTRLCVLHMHDCEIGLLKVRLRIKRGLINLVLTGTIHLLKKKRTALF